MDKQYPLEILQEIHSDDPYDAFWDRINKEINSFHVEVPV